MKIAIVSGGSRGLGKSMCLHIAERGHDVILTYRSRKDEADAVVSEIEKKGRKAAANPSATRPCKSLWNA